MARSVSSSSSRRDTVVVGASSGGIRTLRRLLGALPEDFPAAVLIVLHQGRLAGQLDVALRAASALPLAFVGSEEPIEHGRVYLAPPDRHLIVVGDTVRISAGPREMRTRPAIDPLFRTAAAARGGRVIAVQLTGQLDDGVAGLEAVRRCGGVTLVQEPEEAEYPEMPRAAVNAGLADHIVPLDEMFPLIARLVRESAPAEIVIPADIAIEARLSTDEPSRPASTERIGEQVPVACPDCGGPLWEVGRGHAARYRCHIGHSLSARAVLEAQADDIERSLWVAVRSLTERASVLDRLAENSSGGSTSIVEDYRERAREAQEHAEKARRFLLSLQGEMMPAQDIAASSIRR